MKVLIQLRRHCIQYATVEVSAATREGCEKIGRAIARNDEDLDWCDTKITKHAASVVQIIEKNPEG